MLFTTSSIIFFIIVTIISLFIKDFNLKFAYWLMVFLLYVSYINIYLSNYFYKKLRENPGKIGPRGDQGPQGQKGEDGVCKLEEQCGKIDRLKLTKQILANNIDGYGDILKKLDEGVILKGNEAKINKTIQDFITQILLPISNNPNITDAEYETAILKSIN